MLVYGTNGGTNGGKGLAQADWSGIDGTITLNITFNEAVDQIEIR